MAFGCLDTGIFGNEKIITPEILQRDLNLAGREGLSRAYIFRLGGVNSEHLEIMERFYKQD